jgi:histone deacetylase 1/2
LYYFSHTVFFPAIPEDAVNDSEDDEDKANPDERLTQAALDKRIAPDNEYSDSEDEGEGGRRDQRCDITILHCGSYRL